MATMDDDSLANDSRHDGRWAGATALERELVALARQLALLAVGVHVAAVAAASGDAMVDELAVERKSSATDLVTRVDREAERLIVDALLGARPHDGLLAEEGAVREGTSGVRWIIDPLDGTTNYVYGYPAFCVSVGVEVDGRPAVGVVHDTTAGHVYAAISGHGAECDGRPIHVRSPGRLAEALLATGFSYGAQVRARQAQALTTILPRVRDIRRAGSAALDLCHVAAGRVDAYYELGLSPWDWAAGRIIAMAAGAEVEFFEEPASGKPVIIAAPPALMPHLRALIAEAGVIV
jgi:myo-inositol-1(or 4)-monophosphatase